MDQLLKNEMETLKGEFGKLSRKVDNVLSAIMGNDLTKDGGMVARIIELEKDVEVLEERVEVLEKEKGKSDIYIRIMWGLGGVTTAGIIGYLLNLIFKT